MPGSWRTHPRRGSRVRRCRRGLGHWGLGARARLVQRFASSRPEPGDDGGHARGEHQSGLDRAIAQVLEPVARRTQRRAFAVAERSPRFLVIHEHVGFARNACERAALDLVSVHWIADGFTCGPRPGILMRTSRVLLGSPASGGRLRPSLKWHEEHDRALNRGPRPSRDSAEAGALTQFTLSMNCRRRTPHVALRASSRSES